jgi:hypothetical protein
LKSVTEAFVSCCEEGNFRPLKEKHAAGDAMKLKGPVEGKQ